MADITMVRVDERLVHGQIIIKWLQAKNANKIIIVDNELCKDPIMGNFLSMTVPQNVNLEIYDIYEAVETLNASESNDKAIILLKNLYLVKFMHQKGVKIKEINIGRIPSGPGKKKVHQNVFLSDEDIDAIKYFREKAVPIIVQMVPDSLPILIYDVI